MLRTECEDRLMGFFPEIRPFDSKQHAILDGFKDGSYGVSSLGYGLYATGLTERGYSPERPMGLRFYDGDNIYGVGFFNGRLYFIAPRGRNVAEKIDDAKKRIRTEKAFDGVPIYVRHLNHNLFADFLRRGWLDARENPWHPEAPQEDESYSSGLITIGDVLETPPECQLKVKTLQGNESKNFRCKNRHSCNSFRSWLERNDLEVTLAPYSSEHRPLADFIGTSHFGMLRDQNKAFGSSWEDYQNIVNPRVLEDLDPQTMAFIGFIGKRVTQEPRIPAMLYVGEDLSRGIMGLYAEFTIRDKQIVFPELGVATDGKQAEGFVSNISSYGYITIFNKIKELGFDKVHLGGSETADLNEFKRRLGGKIDPSYWVVDKKL